MRKTRPGKPSRSLRSSTRNAITFDTLCEVGCGTGDILLNLERSFGFSKGYGYEVSPHAYRRAKTKETDRTKFHLESVFDAAAAPFDVMLVIDVIEHVEDYLGFAKQLRPWRNTRSSTSRSTCRCSRLPGSGRS